jgi:hypothetical protein
VAVPVLNTRGTISHTIASVGISGQLDRAASIALAHDMQGAAQTVAAQLAWPNGSDSNDVDLQHRH